MAEGDDKEKVSVLMSPEELINVGKGIGYSGAELQTFVRDQPDRQREERQLEREARREDAEREARKDQAEREARKEEAEREARREEARKEEAAAERDAHERKWRAELNLKNEEVRLRHELEMTRIRSERRERAIGQENDEGEQEGELEEVEGRRKPPRIPMPKFDHDSSQDVSHFLELFEKVAKQNGYPEISWSLAFRVAVAGTKLEHIAAYGETYDDIKNEVLLAHGHTAEQLWRQLTNVKQGDESFRQLFWRTITKLGQFFKLAVKAESLSVKLVLDTLVNYMVLEGCSDELKEHSLEKTLSSLTCKEFQDIGSSFQKAHGRTQRSGRQSFTLLSSEESSTMNAWKVLAEDTVAKLEKCQSRTDVLLSSKIVFALTAYFKDIEEVFADL